MRTLFIYPEFPKTFWSYEKILELVNRKVLLPPLGLVTVAALLPQQWDWLARQPGGASVTLRKLVEQARRDGAAFAVEIVDYH